MRKRRTTTFAKGCREGFPPFRVLQKRGFWYQEADCNVRVDMVHAPRNGSRYGGRMCVPVSDLAEQVHLLTLGWAFDYAKWQKYLEENL